MSNYIIYANVNIHNGTFVGEMPFLQGLNIIGGENGTMKTLLLQQIKSGGSSVAADPSSTLRMLAVSPKRNSERRKALDMLQFHRQKNKTFDSLVAERLGATINLSGFDNYPSLGEVYYLMFEGRCRDGGPQIDHMNTLTKEINIVIGSIFDQYRLVATWNEERGTPVIHIRKNNSVDIPLEGLSTGEEEILSLTTSLYAAREKTDVFLIDEPEVHLNWNLEERLFAYLDDLCVKNDKQAIVATHSRAMFKTRYLSKTTFLSWTVEGKVTWAKKLTPEQYRRIAGEAIEVIGLGDFTRPTFFVEDQAHTRWLETLSRIYSLEVTISECGNSPNVKSLFRLSQREEGWENSFFLVDGDNMQSTFPSAKHFIHLPVYCFDNYLIYPETLATVTNHTIKDVQEILLESILTRRDRILRKNKFFDFLVDGLRPEDLTFERLKLLDASEIIENVAQRMNMTVANLTDKTLRYLHANGNLGEILPKELIHIFEEYQGGGPLHRRKAK